MPEPKPIPNFPELIGVKMTDKIPIYDISSGIPRTRFATVANILAATSDAIVVVVPGAPTAPVVATVTGSTTASVTFTAPVDNGGATITSYKVFSLIAGVLGGQVGTLSSGLPSLGTPGTINASGLTTGQAYTFKVRAVNSAGDSGLSPESNSATPTTGDLIAPTVSTFTPQTPYTDSTHTTFRITFSEPVTGVDITDFEFVGTGAISGSITSVDVVSTTQYDVNTTHAGASGTAKAKLKATVTDIEDIAGNAYVAGEFFSGMRSIASAVDNTIRYWGHSSDPDLDSSAEIISLPGTGGGSGQDAPTPTGGATDNDVSFTITPDPEGYAYFSFPARYGEVTHMTFNFIPSDADFVELGQVDVTPTETGVLEAYRVYRTVAPFDSEATISFT